MSNTPRPSAKDVQFARLRPVSESPTDTNIGFASITPPDRALALARNQFFESIAIVAQFVCCCRTGNVSPATAIQIACPRQRLPSRLL
jgi:hypothetical protein